MNDPLAQLSLGDTLKTQQIGNKMKTRKTPCQGHGKPSPTIVAMECPACGAWDNVNGKWTRS